MCNWRLSDSKCYFGTSIAEMYLTALNVVWSAGCCHPKELFLKSLCLTHGWALHFYFAQFQFFTFLFVHFILCCAELQCPSLQRRNLVHPTTHPNPCWQKGSSRWRKLEVVPCNWESSVQTQVRNGHPPCSSFLWASNISWLFSAIVFRSHLRLWWGGWI